MKTQAKNTPDAKFILRLRSAIKSSGLKQKELADRIKVSATTLSRYCAGTQTPTQASMLRLAKELNLPLAWFYEDSAPQNCANATTNGRAEEIDWRNRALAAEERLDRLETILRELFAFARIGR